MFKNFKFYIVLFAVAGIFGFTDIGNILSSKYMTIFNVLLLGGVLAVAYFKIGSPMSALNNKDKGHSRSVKDDER